MITPSQTLIFLREKSEHGKIAPKNLESKYLRQKIPCLNPFRIKKSGNPGDCRGNFDFYRHKNH